MGFRHYEDHGYQVLPNRLDPRQVAEAASEVRALLEERYGPGGLARSGRETVSDLHIKSPAVESLIRGEPFPEVALALIGADVDLRFSFTMTKTARNGAAVPWHQDWGLDRDAGHARISFWVALTPAEASNGGLRILSGSHLGPLRPHQDLGAGSGDLGIPDLEPEEAERAVDLELEAGDILLLHPQVVHGSPTNVSGRERMALLFSLQAPKEVYSGFWAKSGAVYLRGGKPAWGPLIGTGEE